MNATCPNCGLSNLLTVADVTVVLQEGGRAGVIWGNPAVLPVRRTERVICNFNQCKWEGVASDLREDR